MALARKRRTLRTIERRLRILVDLGAITVLLATFGSNVTTGASMLNPSRWFASWGERSAAVDGNLRVMLKSFSNQIELFRARTGNYPRLSTVATDLTPSYLKSIPALPVGKRKGQTGIAAKDGPSIGWIYDESSGTIRPNTTTETDGAGTAYRDY